MSWGEELWDKYEDVVSLVSQGTRELDTFYKGFLKERSRIENEYAKHLRKMIRTYTPKTNKKATDEESTQTHGFRLILEELGYQAGQHELVADSFGKDYAKDIENRVNEVKKEMKKSRNEADTLQRNLNQSYKALDHSKLKYQKAHIELEITKATYEKTEVDGTVSRNEVDKMKAMYQKKIRDHDDGKGQYANQLMKTNEIQQEHFFTLLPCVLNNIQSLSVGNCDFFKELMSKCVKKEREIAPIVAKCHEEMEKVIEGVNSSKDCGMIVNKLKTGDVPPEDFVFEELQPGMEVKTGTLRKTSRSRSHTNLNVTSPNSFQRKRELEKKTKAHEIEVAKVQKEMKALQMMVQTYTDNPKFGDVKQFQGELETAAHKVQVLESELNAFKTELADVNHQLENIRSKSPSVSRKQYTQSQQSSSSSSSQSDTLERENPKQISSDSSTLASGWGDDFRDVSELPPPTLSQAISIPIPPPMQNVSTSAPPPPPPPPPPVVAPGPDYEELKPRKVVALYQFNSDATDTIPMAEGEEFFVSEGDQDGWTKVQRVDSRFFEDMGEGFVPTSFVQNI
eukprot:GFUD01013363.1.p1 GENE.GFUD01013363.1~~GFUD01013363.1.p1  ORF type:complete len:567 (-),score=164.04 GFUD01013363.1:214-1914(-)